ncbi:hypothetical protein [Saccharopolyspora sp. 5N708]|uniref:hypothetical protein n=1 Tax=Saccharopolyspora sp. 5N708 TaxID=3457424 RepID=UPI003FD27E95
MASLLHLTCSYWNRIENHWGNRRLDEPTPSEIKQLVEYIKTHVVARRNGRGGRSAGEHLIAALRCFYRHAEDDGHISPADNPALDTLLLPLHTETACRGGALALRPQDLDPTQCLVFLREKGETVRWHPVSPTLTTHLQHHAEQRGAPRTAQLLRYTSGRPIITRRYDHLWHRIGIHLPWVATRDTAGIDINFNKH